MYISSWCIYPRGVILTYLATATGIAFWWRVSRVVSKRAGTAVSDLIASIGDNTFSVMCHHVMGFFALKCLFYLGNVLTPAFGLFDVSQFLSNVDYVYYPHGITQFAFVYAVFGIAFSLGVRYLWLKIKNAVARKRKAGRRL